MPPATKAQLWVKGLLAIAASHLVVAQSPTSSNVKTSIVAECPPTTVYAPFAYSACQNCPVATVTNLTQTITVLPDKVKGVQDSCLVPFRDWVFESVKTLTCYPGTASGVAVEANPTPNVERWSIGCQQTITYSTYIAEPTCLTLEGGSTINVPYAPTVVTYCSTQYSTGVTSTFRTQIQETFRTQQVVGAQSSYSPAVTKSSSQAVPTPVSAAATTQPVPTDVLAAFRLYLSTTDTKLNAIPVGEDQSGNIAVGGLVTGIIFSINPAGNLLDSAGNLIFFDPLTASVSRRRKRQDVSGTAPSRNQTESRLRIGISPPPGSVVARFSLNGITLRVVTDQGVTFSFYVCTETPVSQPLLVSRGVQPPPGCFSFNLVTQPDSLGTPSASITTSIPSSTSDTSSSAADTSTSSESPTSVPTLTSSGDSNPSPSTGSTTTPSTSPSTTASTTPSSATPSLTTPASTDLVALATSIIEANSLQSFCSDFLGYTTPVTTQTTGAATTVSETTTVASGETTTLTTEISTETSTVPVTTTTTTTTPIISFTVTSTTTTAVTTRLTLVLPRAAVVPRGPAPPIVTPLPLTAFAPSILSSACSLEATSVSVTSTSTLTTTGTVTDSSTSFTVSNTVVVTISTTETTTFSTDTSTILTTDPTISTTSTDLSTATTTITVATNAPTNPPTYLQLDPNINRGAEYALSDDANHLTDNYFRPALREVFAVTSAGKLYSFTNNAYYFPEAALSGKLFWSPNAALGSNNFFTAVNVSNGKTQAFLRNPLTGNAYQFCVKNVASNDSNGLSGFHIYFVPELATLPANCILTRLFLLPV